MKIQIVYGQKISYNFIQMEERQNLFLNFFKNKLCIEFRQDDWDVEIS